MSSVGIYFSIRSKVTTPEYITDLLGISPAYTCKMGDTRREGQTPFVENVWSYRAESKTTDSVEDSLNDILLVFSKKSKLLVELADSCEIGCDVDIDFGEGRPEIGFSHDFLTFLVNVKANLGIDIY